MKEFGLKLSLLVAVAALAGCADGATETPDIPGCTESVCADATTLNNCVNGVVIPQVCDKGCVGNACVQSAAAGCTQNTCKDDKTLYLCMNGAQSEVPCAYGCANNQCLPKGGGTVNPPVSGCVASVCKDASVLLACTDGVQQEVACPYGCDNGACKSACVANVCKDAGTLLVCLNGVTSEQACPAGCENGACKASCTADFCSDDKILVVCGSDGSSQNVECPYGCADGKCNSMSGSCTDGIRQCNGRDVEVCEGGAWKLFENCANGCENNACKASVGSCNDGDKQCSGNNLEICEGGAWKVSETCANGCENNACTPSTGSCTDGAKQCNGNNLEVCEGSAWKVSENCANGCENNACKAAPVTVDWCDYYDCTSTYGSQCKSQKGMDNAICDSESAYCVNRNASGDSKCGNGETSWSDSSGEYCLLVGKEAACLDVAWDCSAEKLQSGKTVADACKADNASFLASCTGYGYGCGPACSTIGSTGTVCNDFGSQGFYTHPAVCTQVGDNKILVDSSAASSDYTKCENGCNAEGTGCAGGSTPACTNGATQCSGNFVQTCVSGNWQNAATACANGCENGACKPDTGACTNGAKQCNGNVLQTCTNKQWKDTETCANGCENNACKDAPVTVDWCDYFDCTSTYGSQCKSQKGLDNAICDTESAYCVNRNASGDSQCSGGKTSWSDGNKTYCLLVGSNNACLDVSWDCSAEKMSNGGTVADACKADNASFLASCTAYGYGCGPACSTIGSTGTVCNHFGEDGFYTHPAVCTQVGDNKILVDSSEKSSDYTECPNGCNAAGTGCASGGSTCTNGAKQCQGDYVQTCTSGSWVSASSPCPNGCEAGACKSSSSCTNGAKQCSGAYVQTCVSGSWQTASTACPNGCEAGECKSAPSCSDGAKQCSGAYVQTCVSGSWQTASTACPNGCEAGECKSDSGLTECDVYDCSSEYLALCKEYFADTTIAVCDSSRPYCMKKASASCGSGETALAQLYEDDDEKPQVSEPMCLAVGSDASCLPSGSDDEYWDCGSDDCSGDGSYTCSTACKNRNSSFQAYCYVVSGQAYLGCGLSCSKEGDKSQLCGTDSAGSYTYPAVCTKVDSKLIYVDAATSYSDYVDCTGECNAAGTGCK